MANDWYEDYKAKVAKGAKDVRPKKETAQNILFMKAVGSHAFDNGDDRKTFTSEDGTFGFTEHLVNQLMEFAYDQGRKSIDEDSYNKGFQDCWNDVLNKLGVEEKDEY